MFATGCISAIANVGHDMIYENTIGFSEADETKRPVKDEILLFKDEEQWMDFSNQHFKALKLPNIDWKKRGLLLLQSSGTTYKIESVKLNGNKLEVNVSGLRTAMQVTPAPGYENYTFTKIMLVTIDNRKLSSPITPVLKSNIK